MTLGLVQYYAPPPPPTMGRKMQIFNLIPPNLASQISNITHIYIYASAHDGDDASTDNGKIDFRIVAGNDLGLFRVAPDPAAPSTAARVYPQRQLKGFYGNYSLVVQASDRGEPTNVARATFPVCVQVCILCDCYIKSCFLQFSFSGCLAQKKTNYKYGV